MRGRKITDSLKRRLDSALEYLKEHPDVHVIVSGGQGNDEEVTEAYAMAQYLERAGIDCRRIIQEDASVNTLENLKFSRKLIADVDTPVGIVSNNFHVYRGCVYAKRAGFEESISDSGRLSSITISQLFCTGMFCGLETVVEKMLTK